MPLFLYLLAVAVFTMGTSEFMLAGLLPDIADDLGVSMATAGLLTSAFAVGMVVGAPALAALARHWPRRTSLLGFLAVFAAVHVAGALTDEVGVMFVTRGLAAVANAGFLATALTAAAELVPHRKGRALSILLAGTTMATVVGVPGGALLGTLAGWRSTFWVVAALCLPAAVGVLRGIPAGTGSPAGGTRLRRELAQLRRRRLLLVLSLGTLVNAATFGGFTYLAPIVTGVAGLADLWVPVALVLFGLGSFAGVTAAGRLSDRRPGLVLSVAGPALPAAWIGLGLLAYSPAALLLLAFVVGALSFMVGSTLITRALYEAVAAPTMGGSYATAAFNLGAAGGPAVAAAALSSDAAQLGPVWVAAGLVALALGIMLPTRVAGGS